MAQTIILWFEKVLRCARYLLQPYLSTPALYSGFIAGNLVLKLQAAGYYYKKQITMMIWIYPLLKWQTLCKYTPMADSELVNTVADIVDNISSDFTGSHIKIILIIEAVDLYHATTDSVLAPCSF